MLGNCDTLSEGGQASSVVGVDSSEAAPGQPAVRSVKDSEGTGKGAGKEFVPVEKDSLVLMNELMLALQNSPSVESFLQLMLKRMIESSRAIAAFVLAREGDNLHIRASLFETRGADLGIENLLVMTLIEKTLQTKAPLAIADLVRDPRMADLGNLIKLGFRSLVILPYQSSFEDGVFYLLDPVPRSSRLIDDLEFYNFFTNLLPLALLHLDSSSSVAVVDVQPAEKN